MENLSQWRKSLKLSQEKLGRQLGFGDQWKTYQAYESGHVKTFPEDLKKKIRAMGYLGPFPDEESVPLTREDFDRELATLKRQLQSEVDAIKKEVRQMAEWGRKEENKEHKVLGAALAECLMKLGGDPGTPLMDLIEPDQ